MILVKFLILWSSNLKFDDQWIKKPWSHGFDPRNCMISWSWSHKNRDLKFLDHGYSWSRGYDPRNCMISWSWSHENRDLKFLDHGYSCSRGHDPGFSMIFTFWGFSQWSLNSEYSYGFQNLMSSFKIWCQVGGRGQKFQN